MRERELFKGEISQEKTNVIRVNHSEAILGVLDCHYSGMKIYWNNLLICGPMTN